MNIGIITAFPQMFSTLLEGVVGRAIKKGVLHLKYWNPRDYTYDPYKRIDDKSYGGGAGMILKVEPILQAIQAAKNSMGLETKVIYLSPQGQLFNQTCAKNWAQEKNLIFLAGRYEGIDERLMDLGIDQEWSIGDYILSGGELPAMVIIDTIARLLPQVLHNPQSAMQDSFEGGLLDYPHYTRPADIEGYKVPEVLLKGNHASIARWRFKQALGQTWLRRPDLFDRLVLTNEHQQLLQEFIQEFTKDKE